MINRKAFLFPYILGLKGCPESTGRTVIMYVVTYVSTHYKSEEEIRNADLYRTEHL